MSAETVCSNDASLTTLPLDLLTNITKKLEERDEKALKVTCKRMNLLIVRPPPQAHLGHDADQDDKDDDTKGSGGGGGGGGGSSFLTVGVSRDLIPRDGRSTPIPQSPLPFKAATSLQALELENKDVEDREVDRGMDLSDDDESVATSTNTHTNKTPRKKYKVKRNILHWTAELDSAPSSPGAVKSPAHGQGGGGFVHSPRATSPSPTLPTFTLSIQ